MISLFVVCMGLLILRLKRQEMYDFEQAVDGERPRLRHHHSTDDLRCYLLSLQRHGEFELADRDGGRSTSASAAAIGAHQATVPGSGTGTVSTRPFDTKEDLHSVSLHSVFEGEKRTDSGSVFWSFNHGGKVEDTRQDFRGTGVISRQESPTHQRMDVRVVESSDWTSEEASCRQLRRSASFKCFLPHEEQCMFIGRNLRSATSVRQAPTKLPSHGSVSGFLSTTHQVSRFHEPDSEVSIFLRPPDKGLGAVMNELFRRNDTPLKQWTKNDVETLILEYPFLDGHTVQLLPSIGGWLFFLDGYGRLLLFSNEPDFEVVYQLGLGFWEGIDHFLTSQRLKDWHTVFQRLDSSSGFPQDDILGISTAGEQTLISVQPTVIELEYRPILERRLRERISLKYATETHCLNLIWKDPFIRNKILAAKDIQQVFGNLENDLHDIQTVEFIVSHTGYVVMRLTGANTQN